MKKEMLFQIEVSNSKKEIYALPLETIKVSTEKAEDSIFKDCFVIEAKRTLIITDQQGEVRFIAILI